MLWRQLELGTWKGSFFNWTWTKSVYLNSESRQLLLLQKFYSFMGNIFFSGIKLIKLCFLFIFWWGMGGGHGVRLEWPYSLTLGQCLSILFYQHFYLYGWWLYFSLFHWCPLGGMVLYMNSPFRYYRWQLWQSLLLATVTKNILLLFY